jgi:hypothetical protein
MKVTLLEALRSITLLNVYSMRTSGIQLTSVTLLEALR